MPSMSTVKRDALVGPMPLHFQGVIGGAVKAAAGRRNLSLPNLAEIFPRLRNSSRSRLPATRIPQGRSHTSYGVALSWAMKELLHDREEQSDHTELGHLPSTMIPCARLGGQARGRACEPWAKGHLRDRGLGRPESLRLTLMGRRPSADGQGRAERCRERLIWTALTFFRPSLV
jgi:hypothetical protein